MRDNNYLFLNDDLRTFLELEEKKIDATINHFSLDELSKSVDEDLADTLYIKYTKKAPVLQKDKITQKQEETQIDVSNDFFHSFTGDGRPYYIEGKKITFYVPFDGDESLLYYRPSTYNLNLPRAGVGNNEIIISFSLTKLEAQEIKRQLDGILAQIEQMLTWVSNDVQTYNTNLKQKIINKLKTQREKIANDEKFVNELGFPTHK